ncbi:MAG: ribonuclease D [Coriobacteriales bacterium]|jgi:ribonuclease D|nr:ribonuclease D [Coriobacteriales bacterium]
MLKTEPTHPNLINDIESLMLGISRLTNSTILAVDTEFMREKTFMAQLCLLQLATEDDELLIDPLSGVDLSSLVDVLCDPGIVKVLHAGSQDLEILFHVLGQPVTPVFDTQIAAALLGLPQQISLAALVRHYTGVDIKKSDTFSDWSVRPLRPAQLRYALEDVRYLPLIYASMLTELDSLGRLNWLDEEFKALSDPGRYQDSPDKLWQRLKGTSGFSRRQLGILQQLALWRDMTARKRDIPRKWVITDEQLVDIVRRNPKTIEELYQTRGLSERLSRRVAQQVINEVDSGRQMPDNELPERLRKPVIDQDVTASLDLMQALVHLRANEQHIASNILAHNSELQALALGQRHGLEVLQGWRLELIGNELIELLDGRISLSLEQGKLKVDK